MCGGGGSGASDDSYAGGGYAGEIFSGIITVISEEVITITVGDGGAPVYGDGRSGNTGGNSLFGIYKTTNGGIGGGPIGSGGPNYYLGNGASRTTCGGTYTDGILHDELFCDIGYGGQAGAFGDGGNGWFFNPAGAGGIGAGGGGVTCSDGGGEPSGAGGNGRVVVNWDEFVEDGGLLINGTSIPELSADGGMQFYCNDHLGVPYVGPVHAVVIDGTEVWREI